MRKLRLIAVCSSATALGLPAVAGRQTPSAGASAVPGDQRAGESSPEEIKSLTEVKKELTNPGSSI